MRFVQAFAAAVLVLQTLTANAADYPESKQGDWIARDFKFHADEVMPELKLHYTAIGDPAGMPVVVLHGRAATLEDADDQSYPRSLRLLPFGSDGHPAR
jgi:homoserine O-acetyltransferase/O-succinyltransferase